MASKAAGRSMHPMTTPIITECRRQLEPTEHDTFIDDLQPQRQLGEAAVRGVQQLRFTASANSRLR
jgi:hypothetical protein